MVKLDWEEGRGAGKVSFCWLSGSRKFSLEFCILSGRQTELTLTPFLFQMRSH